MQMFDLSKANKKIKKVLIANRGEIASRIIATLKKMNIESIAIYSDIDRNLQFVQEADIAIPLNGKNNQDTYLNGAKIIQIAKELGVDAIHPGYGFLSENQEFSKSVTESGIEFIGPSFKSVSLMGDKLSAKEFALQNKVNVVPGFVGLVSGAQEALQIAKGIGMPVIIKAVAGGGGKGMKIVYQEKDFEEAYINATSEARNNFKDDRVFIEKYVENPRHIEIQILGDKHGNVICLGERECSIQRFNQKIIEEAPSTFVTPELRAAMIQQSATLAKAAGYYSAGTIEYIVDKDRNFYFLEMNTRLQVEHRVTEYINGNMDLVEAMIYVAEGSKIITEQQKIKSTGHSIECRICSEDCSKNFMPSIGRILHFKAPNVSEYNGELKIDFTISKKGEEVTSFYDSMIGKLITFGDTREIAIKNMRKALSELEISGVMTNVNFLEAIMRNDKFISGDISTFFIKQEFNNKFKGIDLKEDTKIIFTLTGIVLYLAQQKSYFMKTNDAPQQLQRKNFYSKLHVFLEQEEYICSINEYSDTSISIENEGKIFQINHSYQNGDRFLKGAINGFSFNVKIGLLGFGYRISFGGSNADVKVYKDTDVHLHQYMLTEKKEKKIEEFKSPMSGVLKRIKIQEGDFIDEGVQMFNIEAMKMENEIYSEFKGNISKILKKEGEMVTAGEVILKIT